MLASRALSMASRVGVAARRCGPVMARAVVAKQTSPVSATTTNFSTASDPNFDPYSNKQQSDSIFRIAQVPVTEVDGKVATCNGGGGPLGAFLFEICCCVPTVFFFSFFFSFRSLFGRYSRHESRHSPFFATFCLRIACSSPFLCLPFVVCWRVSIVAFFLLFFFQVFLILSNITFSECHGTFELTVMQFVVVLVRTFRPPGRVH